MTQPKGVKRCCVQCVVAGGGISRSVFKPGALENRFDKSPCSDPDAQTPMLSQVCDRPKWRHGLEVMEVMQVLGLR